MSGTLVVFVRTDLGSKSRSFVQAAHSVAQFCINNPGLWLNERLIILKSGNEEDVRKLSVKHRDRPQSLFFEPDYGNVVTAVAIFGLEEKEIYSYNLL
jgi:hypothetical protein